MFPSMKELDSQVRLAEEEVMRSDQRLRGTAQPFHRADPSPASRSCQT